MTDWPDRINATLLDIDQWFGVNGDVIPEVPRAELERHLRRLSEQIHGYKGFLGGGAPAEPEMAWLDGTQEGQMSPVSDPAYKAAQIAENELYKARLEAIRGIPVIPFGHDAALAKCAMDRRDAQSFDKVALVVIWVIVIIGVAAFLLSDWSPARADEAHMDRYHRDPQYHEWLNGLQRPDQSGSCCNLNDCEQTEAEWRDGQWVAIVRGHWRAIPPGKVVDNDPSPDGEAYVCAQPSGGVPAPTAPIYCFVPPRPGF